DAAARTIDELVSVKSVEAAQEIAERVSEINRVVTEQTNGFAPLVVERSEQLHALLQNHGGVLRDAPAAKAQAVEERMSASTQRITADVNAALEKLNQSNQLLQTVLDSAGTDLARLEGSVAEQTSTYSATVRDAIATT